MPSELSYEERGHVGIITLQRPEARNALTFTIYAATLPVSGASSSSSAGSEPPGCCSPDG